mmetsp:Transcript_3928/g.11149  ORF Transcript_3928/g.11149 Transcript_3928/m.11149 type:complete len:158 (-) Transcript_3928:1163-1636(-)
MTAEEEEEGKRDLAYEDSMPQSYGLVLEQYAKLQSAIEQFEDSITNVLASQTSCFLAASKNHLAQKVLPDIKSLHETVEAKERAIATDERLQRCQEERGNFKKEALHLDKTVEKLQRDKKALQEQIQDLEQDKRWMEKRLKLSTKQKKGGTCVGSEE